MTMEDRFMRKVAIDPAGCWNWTGAKVRKGYGSFRVGDRMLSAHRVAYELFVGPIPDGLVLDHLCRNRACVRPDHLEPKTNRDNILAPGAETLAKRQSERTHCPRSHPLQLPNLVASELRKGGRECLACARARCAV